MRRATAERRREGGRHRLGLPYVRVGRTWWDPAARAAAAQLDMFEPGWLVFYSLGRRVFYAIAAGAAQSPLLVEATTVERLRKRMREAEFEDVTTSWRREHR